MIKKYTKKQENLNRRLGEQLMELTGVSTFSLNSLLLVESSGAQLQNV
jgi:hypothetical protein